MSRMSGLVIDQIKHMRAHCLELNVSHGRKMKKVKKERDEPFRLADCRPRPADRDVWPDGRHTLTGPRLGLTAWSKVSQRGAVVLFFFPSFPLSCSPHGPPGLGVFWIYSLEETTVGRTAACCKAR